MINEQEWATAQRQLASGEVVGFPTETVWGLGVSAQRSGALKRLQQRKGRAATKALQVSCAAPEQLRALASSTPIFEALLALLPAPLTLVAPAAPSCPAWLVSHGKVGLRMPQHPLAQELLARCGPLATTSFNVSGQPPALTHAQALNYQQQHHLADVLLWAGPEPSGLPSTVVDCQSGAVLRQGAFSANEFAQVLRSVQEKT